MHSSLKILCLACLLMAFRGVEPPKKILFFGDSITQAGVKPGGYIDRMNGMLEKNGQKDKYELIGAGISGNKIYDLFLRLEDDVLAKKPDVVVIWIGINDVWHKASHRTGTDAPKFEAFYNALIKKMQAQGIKVVVATPGAIGEKTDYTNEQDGDLNAYSQMIRGIAAKFNCEVADMRKVFLQYNLEHNKDNLASTILTTDRVHLNDTGNQLVAETFYNLLIGR